MFSPIRVIFELPSPIPLTHMFCATTQVPTVPTKVETSTINCAAKVAPQPLNLIAICIRTATRTARNAHVVKYRNRMEGVKSIFATHEDKNNAGKPNVMRPDLLKLRELRTYIRGLGGELKPHRRWTCDVRERNTGKLDVYFFLHLQGTRGSVRFRSRLEVARYLGLSAKDHKNTRAKPSKAAAAAKEAAAAKAAGEEAATAKAAKKAEDQLCVQFEGATVLPTHGIEGHSASPIGEEEAANLLLHYKTDEDGISTDADIILSRCDADLSRRLYVLVKAFRHGTHCVPSNSTARRRYLAKLHPDKWITESSKQLAQRAFVAANDKRIACGQLCATKNMSARGSELLATATDNCCVM